MIKKGLVLATLILCFLIPEEVFFLQADSSQILLMDYPIKIRTPLAFWRTSLGRIPEAEKPSYDDSTWDLIHPPYRWKGTSVYCWFRTWITIPTGIEGKAVYLKISLDSEGQIFINGKPAGFFYWDRKVLLTPSAKAGDRFLIAVKGRSETVFGMLIDAYLLYRDAGLHRLQSNLDLIHQHARETILYTNGSWKFLQEDKDIFREPDLDDSEWNTVYLNHRWEGTFSNAWYRKKIIIPAKIHRYTTKNAQISFDFKVDDDCQIFVNGKFSGFFRRYGSVILTENARPGEEFRIAVRLINRQSYGSFIESGLKLGQVYHSLNTLASLLEDTVSMLDRILQGSRHPLFAPSLELSDQTILAANQMHPPLILKCLLKTDDLSRKISGFFATHPLIIKGPYLQNINQDEATILWETNIPTNAVLSLWSKTSPIRTIHGIEPATLHKISINGLKAGRTYSYQIQSGKTICPVFTLKTAPREDKPFRFAVLGDTANGEDAFERNTEEILRHKPDFTVHVGDMVSNGRYEEWGREFFFPARHLLRNIPVYTVAGNHEYNSAVSGNRVLWYERFFQNPGNPYWYSFNYGNSHFIFLDSNKEDPADISPGSEQYRWLINDLESDKSRKAKWRFVFIHHPLYSEGWAEEYYDGEELLRKNLVPLLEKYYISMIFQGHTHDFEFGQWPPGTGPCYVITGGGGSPLDDTKYREWPQIQVQHFAYHFCLLDVKGNRLLFRAIDSHGHVFHRFEITNREKQDP